MNFNVASFALGIFVAYAIPLVIARMLRGRFQIRGQHWSSPDDTDTAGADRP